MSIKWHKSGGMSPQFKFLPLILLLLLLPNLAVADCFVFGETQRVTDYGCAGDGFDLFAKIYPYGGGGYYLQWVYYSIAGAGCRRTHVNCSCSTEYPQYPKDRPGHINGHSYPWNSGQWFVHFTVVHRYDAEYSSCPSPPSECEHQAEKETWPPDWYQFNVGWTMIWC